MTSDHLLQDGCELLHPELRSSWGHQRGLHHAMYFGRAAAVSSVFVGKKKQIAPNMLPAAGHTGLNTCRRVLLPPMTIHPRTPGRRRYPSVSSGFWYPIYPCHALNSCTSTREVSPPLFNPCPKTATVLQIAAELKKWPLRKQHYTC